VAHGVGTRDHGALRIDLPPHGDVHAVVAHRIDRIEEAGMHLHKVDRAEIGDSRRPPARDPRRGIGKAEAAVDHRNFLVRPATQDCDRR